jgi:preprotein translocase SecF subunit
MGVNVLGYLFARVLMSLPIAEELSRIKITVNSLADRFSRFNLMRFRYQPIGAGLVLLSLLAIFVYPGIPLAPVFSGGKALEVEFNQPVPENAVQQKLAGLVGKGAEIMTEESEGMVKWALVKFPAKVNLQEQEVMNALAAIGAEPKLMSIQTISRTLVTKTRMQISAEMFLGFALLIVLAIVIYNMKAGFYIIVSLLHDVIICLGVMALFRISLDLVSIAALVTMAGYSINDSIVILHKLKQEKNDIMPSQAYSELGRQTLKSLCAENIRNVTARVFITALTTALPMLIMALMAGSVFVDYGIIIFTGIFFGSLSSIYIVGRVLPTGFIKW